MEIFEKPPKMKLISAAESFFSRNRNVSIVGIRTKEGREFWFRRDPLSGRAIKISKEQAENL